MDEIESINQIDSIDSVDSIESLNNRLEQSSKTRIKDETKYKALELCLLKSLFILILLTLFNGVKELESWVHYKPFDCLKYEFYVCHCNAYCIYTAV